VAIKVRSRRAEQGQAAWEFLLVLPIFVGIMLVIIDFGLLMYQYVSVVNAVREGARYGAVACAFQGSCTADEIKQRVLQRSGGMLSNPNEVYVAWANRAADPNNAAERGDSVVVWVVHPYSFLFLINPFDPQPITMNVFSCAEMMLEQSYTTRVSPSNVSCGQ
jgi:Flp pilus assembly protein TadG